MTINITILILTLLILAGALFLALSIAPMKKVSNVVKDKGLKLKWKSLITLVVIFILGYIYYSYIFFEIHIVNYVVPFIFFGGGFFVYLVGLLARNTALDINKMSSLEQEKITDALMQIHNRRHFDNKLHELVLLASRYNNPLSLLIIDLDNFKRVNDTYGHLVGDNVLKSVAKTIQNVIRDVDIVARYGGEELAVITPHSSIEQAMVLAERIRNTIDKEKVSLDCFMIDDVKVTVSIGVSTLKSRPDDSPIKMIQDADQALYRAKKEGRNLVLMSK